MTKRRSFLPREFTPALFDALEHYRSAQFWQDLASGVTVGIIALPLAMAFAIASGVPPERGLFTAIVAGFLISALGGSHHQIGGPTGAFVVIVYGVVHRHGYEGLVLATLMAGAILIAMGGARLGNLIKLIPYPVTTGFTSGIALIIFSSQVKDFFGLAIENVPPDFFHKWEAFALHAHTLNPPACAVGAASLLAIVALRRWAPRIPGYILAIVAAAAAVKLLGLPVETIGSRFGGIPHHPPAPSLPAFDFDKARAVLPEAITIAMLAGIESLLSAVVADGMTGQRHKPDCELAAQGVANIASAVFGGIPATGAIARTAANIKAGAQSPVSGLLHAATLFVCMLALAPWAALIPMPALAAVLMVVAWNMSERDHFKHLLRAPKSDVVVLLTTFGLTVLVDLTVAVQVGVVMAAMLFIKRMSDSGQTVAAVKLLEETDDHRSDPDAITRKRVPEGVEVFEVNGPFFFGVADELKDALNVIERPPKAFILRMRHVPMIDATGLYALREFHSKCRRQGTVLLLSGVRPALGETLRKAGIEHEVGRENILPHIDAALARAAGLAATPKTGE